MEITIFKIFITGGISSDIRLEITFYGSAYINKNEAYNTMPANVLLFYTPLTPVRGQKVKTFF